MKRRTETDEANTHACGSAKTHAASKRRVRRAGKSRRALSPMVSRGAERSIKRRVERVERRSVHQCGGEQVGEVGEGRGQVCEEKNHTAHTTHTQHIQPHVSLGGSDGRDGVVWPWCRTPKASGGSAPRSAESSPAPHACYGREHFSPACGGVMCSVRHNLVLKVETSGLMVQTVANRMLGILYNARIHQSHAR
jgi:hypothetical protein